MQEWTPQQLQKRLVRYRDLVPCVNAFIDTYTPGSDRKENFTIIGPGVAEHPDQHVHISIPHGFNIGAARQPPGCHNSQHSHDTEEVFVVHSGRWAFRWGHDGSDGEVELGPGDCISLPTGVFRGFENIGEDIGFLFAVLGGDDPGNVHWAPYVFEAARDHGLVLLENGQLVDTTKGEAVPAGLEPMKPTTRADLSAYRRMSKAEMNGCVVLAGQQKSAPTLLAQGATGVRECALIGPANPLEQSPAGTMAWRHGFHVRRLDLGAGATIPLHQRFEQEVLFVHSGEVELSWPGGALALGEGDVMTVPIDMPRGLANRGDRDTVLYVVRGGDRPAAPKWLSPLA